MAFTHFYYRMAVCPTTTVRAWLNDVPFFQYGTGENQALTRSSPAVHLLVPGENTFAIEVEHIPKGNTVIFEILADWEDKVPALYFDSREVVRELPERLRSPLHHEMTFCPIGTMFTPTFLRAEPQPFGCEGTPELYEAVRRVNDAVERRDADAFMRELSLKFDEQELAYAGWEEASRKDFHDDIRSFFATSVESRPLDLSQVHFESRAGGRVAVATRISGGPLFEATSNDDPTLRFRSDLVLTRHAGAWRCFR